MSRLEALERHFKINRLQKEDLARTIDVELATVDRWISRGQVSTRYSAEVQGYLGLTDDQFLDFFPRGKMGDLEDREYWVRRWAEIRLETWIRKRYETATERYLEQTQPVDSWYDPMLRELRREKSREEEELTAEYRRKLEALRSRHRIAEDTLRGVRHWLTKVFWEEMEKEKYSAFLQQRVMRVMHLIRLKRRLRNAA